MKLLSLNIWGAQVHEPLMNLIKKYNNKVDFFTFQEIFKSDRDIISHGVYSNNLAEIASVLKDYDYHFKPTNDGFDLKGPVDFPLDFGQATFWKKEFKIIDKGDIFVYKTFNEVGVTLDNSTRDFPRNFVYTKFMINNQPLLILNLHGYWEPAPKYDTPQRFKQSQIILDFIEKENVPTILAGDFNLAINTLSIGMIEAKMINLISKFGIKSTRSSLYDPKYKAEDKFADYIFINENIKINKFEVLKDEVSDHLPLYLDFDIK